MEKKILYTTSMASPQSGAYKMLVAMAKGVRSNEYNAYLVLPRSNELDSFPNLESGTFQTIDIPILKRGKRITYYFLWLFGTIVSAIKLVKIIYQEDISIVHANEFLDLYAGIAAILSGRKLVWHVRADLSPWPIAHWILPRIIVLLSDSIFVVSKSVEYHMFQKQGIESNKFKVIYDPGPNPKRFHPSVDGEYIREEFDIDDKASIVSLVGKLSNRKGHDVLIRAAPKLLADLPNTFFLIVGGVLESEHHKKYASDLRSLPSELGVERHVIFTGYRSDIPQIMAASNIMTHCSTYPDPFPGVVLQGMALGKPVVASDLGGPREQIIDGVTGLLVEPGNPSALAEAISSLLKDKNKCEYLGRKASNHVRTQFSSDRYFYNLIRYYDRLFR